MIIRDATDDDVAAITDLYNALVATTTVAWSEELQTSTERRRWFEERTRLGDPVLVAEHRGEVVGFCSFAAFLPSEGCPCRHTVEHTIHVQQRHWGRGVAARLMEELERRAAAAEVHVMVASIDSDNAASIRFHARLGFVEVGRMPEVGRKFDRWVDLVLMQRILGD